MKTTNELAKEILENAANGTWEDPPTWSERAALYVLDVWANNTDALRRSGTLGRALAQLAIVRRAPLTDEPFWARVSETSLTVAQNNILAYGGVEFAIGTDDKDALKIESTFIPVYRVAEDDVLLERQGFTRYDVHAVRDMLLENSTIDPMPLPLPGNRIPYRIPLRNDQANGEIRP